MENASNTGAGRIIYVGIIKESCDGENLISLFSIKKKHDGCGGGVPKEFKTKGAQSSGCVVIKPEHELCLFTRS